VQELGAGSPRDAAGAFENVARSWQRLGLRPGDLVLLALPNGVGLLAQFFGALLAGAVPALVAPNTTAARMRELVRVLGARAVGALRLPEGLLKGRVPETIGAMQIVLFPPSESPPTAPGEVVLLTSGTSGFASGCVFGLESLLLNAERHADAIGQRPSDTVLVNLPLHFSFALVAQALATLVRGGRLVIDGPPFHAAAYLEALSRQEITISSLTPVLVHALLKSQQGPPAGLRVLTVGGATLEVEQVERLLRWRPDRELYLTYGLTQAGPRVSTLAAASEPPERYRSVGRPVAGTKVWLEDFGDSTNKKQLMVSSETVMRRRIGLVEGCAPRDCSGPGTVATGDVFEQDAEGYLYFLGRVTDFIIRNGEKICLAAVRRVATQLPAVIQVKIDMLPRENGQADFDLTLHTAGHGNLPEGDYAGQLRRHLRAAEMPRRIRVVTTSDAFTHHYK